MEEGLYEKLITNQIKNYLEHTDKNREIEPIEQEEANIILAKHVKDVVEKALKQIEEDEGIKGEEKLEHQVALTNRLITLIKEDRGNDFNEEIVWGEASMLYALKSTVVPLRPRTPLSQKVLLPMLKMSLV